MVAMFGVNLDAETAPAATPEPPSAGAGTFDPAASTRDAEGRQAVADEIFFPAVGRTP